MNCADFSSCVVSLIGVPPQALFGQLLLGLINGSFYAILSLGLAVIFGLLNIVNFTHGAQYMLGAFGAYFLLNNGYFSIGYWPALILSPLIGGLFGMLLERNLISQLSVKSKARSLTVFGAFFVIFIVLSGSNLASALGLGNGFPDLPGILGYSMDPALAYGIAAVGALLFATVLANTGVLETSDGDQHSDHLYGLLLTFGLAIIIQGLFVNRFGSTGLPYTIPAELSGGKNLGFMFLPIYRGWVVIASLAVCIATWLMIEKTKLGAYLRAATENPTLLQAFGVNVPLLITFTYGLGVALAAFAGVLAAPIYSVNPNMGADLIIVVFAVVVIGGMGSIMGAIVTGFTLGIVEGLTKVFYPQASSTVIFVIMAIVLLIKPAGLFGKAISGLESMSQANPAGTAAEVQTGASTWSLHAALFLGLSVLLAVLPSLGIYPYVLAQMLCFALFACAFNLMLGYGGLLSFGHAMFFGFASYVAAYTAKHGIDSLPFWLPGIGPFSISVGLAPFSPELAMLTGAAVAAGLGFVAGSLAIRRQGIYFAMVTLALAQMVYFFCLQAPFTGGENGIQAVPRGTVAGVLDLQPDSNVYYATAAVFMAGFLLIARIVDSPFGQVLKAIRDNEPRAISLGYRAQRYKLAVFVLSATLAGVAGGMKAVVSQLATLTDVHWSMSGEVVLMTLVGGMGAIFGPLAGAVIIVAIQNYLNSFGAWVIIVQGTIFVVCVLLFKEGIVGVLARAIRRPL